MNFANEPAFRDPSSPASSPSSKEIYRRLCRTEESIPLFSRDWWLDAACGRAHWDVLLVERKNSIRAALPFYRPCPGIITLPPYTQTMGVWFAPLAGDIKYASALERRQALCRLLTEQLKSCRFFMQNFHHSFTDWLPFYWQNYRQTTRYTYLLTDLKNSSRLWENMSHNARHNIRRAREEHHVTVRPGIPVDDFLRVQAQTFERQQIRNPQSSRALRRLIAASRLRKQGELWGGYDRQGRLHAAVFVAWQKTVACYVAGGGDPEVRHSGAHGLVLWEAIRHAAAHSDTFDFEGSMLPGVERFFREFGGVQTPYFSISRGKLSLLDRVRMKWSIMRQDAAYSKIQ
jgi:hypothetical protein